MTGITERALFVIPIYYRSPELHRKEYKKRFTEFTTCRKKQWGDLFEQEYGNDSLKPEVEFQSHWYSWKYTQIIKIVEIRLEFSILKAYLFSVEAKRYRAIMNKKVFQYVGKITDVAFLESHYRDDEIKQYIFDFIEDLRETYKNYYVDSCNVDILLPLLDFTKLRAQIGKI